MRVPDDNLDVLELEHRYPDETVWQGWLAIAVLVGAAVAFLFLLCQPSRAQEPQYFNDGCALCIRQIYPERRPIDSKMEDAIRNGLSLSVSTCFNIYTQNPMGTEQDHRLERCLGRVLAGHQIAQSFLAKRGPE